MENEGIQNVLNRPGREIIRRDVKSDELASTPFQNFQCFEWVVTPNNLICTYDITSQCLDCKH